MSQLTLVADLTRTDRVNDVVAVLPMSAVTVRQWHLEVLDDADAVVHDEREEAHVATAARRRTVVRAAARGAGPPSRTVLADVAEVPELAKLKSQRRRTRCWRTCALTLTRGRWTSCSLSSERRSLRS